MSNLRLAIPTLAFLLLLCALPSCGGRDEPEPAAQKGTDAETSMPAEPLEFPVAPLAGDTHLDLSVRVHDAQGKKVKLSSLVRERTLLLFVQADGEDKQDKAAARMLRPIALSGRPAGFRMIAVFPKGSKAQGIDSWFRQRRIPREVLYVIDAEGEFAASSRWSPRTAALIDDEGLVGALFEPTEEWDARLGFAPGLSSDILFKAWELPDSGPEVDAATRQAAVDLVRSTLQGEAGRQVAAPAGAPGLDGRIAHPVFVSLFRPGQTSRLRGRANEGRLGEALVAATKDALGSSEERAAWLESVDTIRFQVDLMGEPGPIPTTSAKALWFLLEPGVHGFIVREGDKEGLVLPAEPVTQGWLSPRVRERTEKHKKMFRTACKRAGLPQDAWTKEGTELLRFRTTSFGVAVPDGPAVAMFRGKVLFEGEPTEQDVLQSIKDGGRWLVNTVKADGKFDYEYYPNQDKGSRDYSIVRHAGSVYGLFEMFEFAGTEPLLAEDRDLYIDAAARSMGYIYDALARPEGAPEGRVCLLDDRKRCDSGSAALTLITFLVRPRREAVPEAYRDRIYRDGDEKLMEGLALTMLDMIDEDGKVFRSYGEALAGGKVKKEPLYYPGETMLALVRFHEATSDPRWLDGARRIAERQMRWYEKDRFGNPDHWVMQALYRLWRLTKDDRYAENAYAMGRHYASEMYGPPDPQRYGPLWSPWPDYVGSYRRTDDLPRTTRAGSRSEALRAVVNLAWEKGDEATVYEDALIGAARHLMEQQFTAKNNWWIPDPARVHGAYPMGVVDNHCRIDNNQHVLVGMVGTLQVMRRRAAGPPPGPAAPEATPAPSEAPGEDEPGEDEDSPGDEP